MPDHLQAMSQAMRLFERASRLQEAGVLPEGIPTCWEDVNGWIQTNGWRHPGGIPPPTLEKFLLRLRFRLNSADPTESDITRLQIQTDPLTITLH